ncbi:MAG: hypothetical protein V1798_08530, partial [Pseudomonadota bacterium]
MTRVGIDIGAVFVKAVRVDDTGKLLVGFYERHRGQPAEALAEAMDRLDVTGFDEVGLTGCNAELFARTMGIPYRDI